MQVKIDRIRGGRRIPRVLFESDRTHDGRIQLVGRRRHCGNSARETRPNAGLRVEVRIEFDRFRLARLWLGLGRETIWLPARDASLDARNFGNGARRVDAKVRKTGAHCISRLFWRFGTVSLGQITVTKIENEKKIKYFY